MRLRRGLRAAPTVLALAAVGVAEAVTVIGAQAVWIAAPVAVLAAMVCRRRRGMVASVTLTIVAGALPVALDSSLGPLPPVALVVAVVVLSAATARVFRERFDAQLSAINALAATDPLTGLANLRRFGERLEYEVARHAREGRSFAVFALDLDRFKQVNDRLGHAAGDEVLSNVADAMQAAVRDPDTVARVGGDEFAVLGPETGRAHAREIEARLSAAVRRATCDLGGVGVSVGTAIFPDDGAGAERLMLAADAALLGAKRRSRAARATAAASTARVLA